MPISDYPFPVNQLLTYGKCHIRKWPDYLKLGLTHKHIPQLMKMVADEDLHRADSDSKEVWAPVHAWRTLGQLRATEAIKPLLAQLRKIDEEEDDWVGEEMPEVFGMIGKSAIPHLAEYLSNQSHGLFARICASSSIEQIGIGDSTARLDAVTVLSKQLERYAENDLTLNGFLVASLVDLKGVEALSIIRKAFEAGCVDCSVVGDLEDVEVELGIKDPRRHPGFALSSQSQNAAVERELKSEKVGRNAPCPCGSGKKYKKCCMKE